MFIETHTLTPSDFTIERQKFQPGPCTVLASVELHEERPTDEQNAVRFSLTKTATFTITE